MGSKGKKMGYVYTSLFNRSRYDQKDKEDLSRSRVKSAVSHYACERTDTSQPRLEKYNCRNQRCNAMCMMH